MLDEKDLRSIRGIVSDVVSDKIEGNNQKIFAAIEEGDQKVILAVGEMLEQNVFPQFEEIHREFRRVNVLLGWQR